MNYKKNATVFDWSVSANLDNCWSNFLTRTSQDPGFLRSMFTSELITVRKIEPSGSLPMAYKINANMVKENHDRLNPF